MKNKQWSVKKVLSCLIMGVGFSVNGVGLAQSIAPTTSAASSSLSWFQSISVLFHEVARVPFSNFVGTTSQLNAMSSGLFGGLNPLAFKGSFTLTGQDTLLAPINLTKVTSFTKGSLTALGAGGMNINGLTIHNSDELNDLLNGLENRNSLLQSSVTQYKKPDGQMAKMITVGQSLNINFMPSMQTSAVTHFFNTLKQKNILFGSLSISGLPSVSVQSPLGQAIQQYATIQTQVSRPSFYGFNGQSLSFSMTPKSPTSPAMKVPSLTSTIPTAVVPRALLPASPPVTAPAAIPREVLQTNSNPAQIEKGLPNLKEGPKYN